MTIMRNCGLDVVDILKKYSLVIIPVAFEQQEPQLNEYVREHAPPETFSKIRPIPCYSKNAELKEDLDRAKEVFYDRLASIKCKPHDTVAVLVLFEGFVPNSSILGAHFYAAAAKSALFPDIFIH